MARQILCLLLLAIIAGAAQGAQLIHRRGGARRRLIPRRRRLAAGDPVVNELVVLGDSYSDTGRSLAETNGVDPDPQWYWQGRWSSGPSWPDYVYAIFNGEQYVAGNTTYTTQVINSITLSGWNYTAPKMNDSKFKVLNLAYGGAAACEENSNVPDPQTSVTTPWLDLQINDYEALLNNNGNNSGGNNQTQSGTGSMNGTMNNGTMNNGTMMMNQTWTFGPESIEQLGPAAQRVVVVEFGGNDYLNQLKNISAASDFDTEWGTIHETVVGCIKNGTKRLLDLGEQNIIIFTLPAVDLFPQAQELGDGLQGFLTDQMDKHNTLLRQAIFELQQNYTQAKLYVYELGNATDTLVNNPSAYNITNTEDSCLEYGSQAGNDLGEIPVIGDDIGGFVNTVGGTQIQGRCQDDNAYVWHDKVHPTTHTHKLYAEDIIATIQAMGLRGNSTSGGGSGGGDVQTDPVYPSPTPSSVNGGGDGNSPAPPPGRAWLSKPSLSGQALMLAVASILVICPWIV